MRERLVAWGMAVLLGVAGAIAYNMYHRHNVQHWQMEQMIQQQDRINKEFAQAINALIARK